MKIKSLKEDSKHFNKSDNNNNTGAIDWQYERLSGGGTPGGLDRQIVRSRK